MQATLINLAMNMRTLGSKFTLAFAVFMSSGFAFLVALTIVSFFGTPISTFELLESIPFIVVAIGFEKPFQLTKSVFLQTESTSSSETIRDKILNGVFSVAPSILFEYFIEISILLVGGMAGVDTTLGRICFLASLIVAVDAIFLFTFYLSVLTLKLEVVYLV
jgi:hydroxymethylglutaryl-CoA reductase (NADPH)